MKINRYSTLKYFLLLSIFFTVSSCSRNGDQLYVIFFGQSNSNCTQIINYQDHRAFDDPSAWMSFKTCKSEIERILLKRAYTKTIVTKKEAFIRETATYGGKAPQWWTPSKLGDSCFLFEFHDTDKGVNLFLSIDSSLVYYRDITP